MAVIINHSAFGMITKKKLLYFSLNPHSTKAFYDYIERTLQDRRNSFRICTVDKKSLFKHPSDLTLFLEEQSDLGMFYVIIDYLSFFNCHLDDKTNEEKDNKDTIVVLDWIKDLKEFSIRQASEIIAKTILRFPEVMFLFDESWQKGLKDDVNFTNFIFYDGCDVVSSVYKRYHQYRVYEEAPFAFIGRNWDNLYDGSNLRFAIKRYYYQHLRVKRYNFSAIQDARAKDLALCVEEEHSQNRFNSYALFANGFRVLPISSSQDLKNLNLDKEVSHSIVIRDYDLQFSDEDSEKKVPKQLGTDSVEINTVDYIRGAKYISDSKDGTYKGRWHVPVSDNDEYNYWSVLSSKPTYFVSKGGPKIITTERRYITEREKLLKKQRKFKKNLGKKQKDITDQKTIESIKSLLESIDNNINTDSLFLEGVTEQVVRGLEKPVSGLYLPFQSFMEVKKQYYQFGKTELVIKPHAAELAIKCKTLKDKISLYRYLKEDDYFKIHLITTIRIVFLCRFNSDENKEPFKDIIEKDRHRKEQGWNIITDRENHNHGVPLDLYDLAKSMIERASNYYKREKYIKAAVISSETIEILNGFHEALMLQAYHLLAISENAIAMNTIGSNESALKSDAEFRIKKIELDVDRMLARGRKERRDLRYNILNHIFVDCRNFCKEKEHFKAENCFISAMAHVNEGYTPCDIYYAIKDKCRLFRNKLGLF